MKFSVLLDLPYFDIIATCAIDPMHNLFLGTSKHMMEVWQKANIINAKDVAVIQDKVNSMIPPSDVGRIPAKISSNFNDFTADEWKNWTLIYTVYALNDILPTQQMAMWELYVRACTILCTRVIITENLKLAHTLLIQFNRLIEQILGPEHCSINMHLHCHLAESVLKFGPIYNGILGSYSTNNHSINVQVMRKFTLHQSLEKYVLDCDFISNEYENIVSNLGSHFSNACSGSLKLQQLDSNVYKVLLAQRFGNASDLSYNADNKDQLCGRINEGALSDLQHDTMTRLYTSLYVNTSISHVSRLFLRAADVELHSTNEHYSSSLSISKTSNCVYALNTSLTPPRNQLCSIEYFLKHAISFKNTGTVKPSQHTFSGFKFFLNSNKNT